MLSQEQARLADEATSRVRAAVQAARDAVGEESTFLTWLTNSESAANARRESLRQSERILEQLEQRRPGLEPAGLVGFLELAGAGAEVGALLASAKRMTAAGFKAEVVTPTLRDLNPLNLDGKVGRALLIGAAVLLAVHILKD